MVLDKIRNENESLQAMLEARESSFDTFETAVKVHLYYVHYAFISFIMF